MKRYFYLALIAIISFSSCENVEDNSAVIQANIDSTFFKSFGANGLRTDGGVQMQGLTNAESLTLFVRSIQLGSYTLGENWPSYAFFEDSQGNVYSTTVEGASGTINVTDRCVSCGQLTGDFQFTAILPGVDTIYVDKGVFFEVTYPTSQEGNNNDGTFSANVDGTPFNASVVNAVDSGNSLLISGVIAQRTIVIRLPIAVEVGNVPLPTTGYQASYTIGTDTENALTGNISVVSHDTNARTISGTFAFETTSNTISGGQFNVSY